MKFCQYCGQQLLDQAVVCPNCGCATGPQPQEDKVSIWLCILLGHCWPLAVIYWAVKQKETPKRAKAVALSPLAVFGFWFVFYILIGLIL